MTKRDDGQELLRWHLGQDWELRLRAANATAGPGFTQAEVHAAQQRAIALARASNPRWADHMSELVAEAWLDSQPVSAQVARGLRRLGRRRARRVALWSA
ncbi:MAG: hypothetical protein ABI658_06785 [Acidimicrobiales bacterium]